ncbi:hypothetical protein [Roseivirga sp. UBA838]|uniref:hypothetical protein n=1 Tax=Roseivirga sp. UBA838 TaxID=1947393 RepID=UPI00257A3ECC|nr:hypothetical protein [Roseivirga sp. UBA838]
MLETDDIDKSQIVIIEDFHDQRLLTSLVSTTQLDKVKILNGTSKSIFTSNRELYELPTFFIYSTKKNIGHSLYQATTSSKRQSRFYLQSVSKRLRSDL